MRWPNLTLFLLLAVMACSGGDDDDDQDEPPTAAAVPTTAPAADVTPSGPTATIQIVAPSPTPEPTATATATEVEPTETEIAATSTPTPSAATATAITTPSVTPTIEMSTATSTLESTATEDETTAGNRPEDALALSLLVDETDLPEDWLLVDRIAGSDSDGEAGLCGALPISQFATPTGISEAHFQISDDGPFIQEGIALFETEEDAVAGIEYIRESLTCTEWTQVNGPDEINWTLAPLAWPAVGDDRVAYEITFGAPTVTLQGDYVLIRQDRALILLVTFAVDERVPFETVVNVAEAAAERVANGL